MQNLAVCRTHVSRIINTGASIRVWLKQRPSRQLCSLALHRFTNTLYLATTYYS
jgi:hypothetical protein